jgi:hypothetical protein
MRVLCVLCVLCVGGFIIAHVDAVMGYYDTCMYLQRGPTAPFPAPYADLPVTVTVTIPVTGYLVSKDNYAFYAFYAW